MKKIIVRADDLGFTEGVNYGIEKACRDGIIRSVGIMTNMPATKHGYDLVKDHARSVATRAPSGWGAAYAVPGILLWRRRCSPLTSARIRGDEARPRVPAEAQSLLS